MDSPGAKATLETCRKIGKTTPLVEEGITLPSQVARWIRQHQVRTLNVAGNRESKSPGIGERVEACLGQVFRQLGHRPVG